MKAMVLGQHVPAIGESEASGPFRALITADSPIVETSFKINPNPRIVWKHPGDSHMSHKLSEHLDTLAELVAIRWPGLLLRVTATWDPTGKQHHPHSLHGEGRAADLTVSDRDPRKLGELADLAARAGFSWSFYEDALHVHASVPASW